MEVKYKNKIRLCPDVAIVDGEGVRLEAFDYSKRKIVSINDWNKAVLAKVLRVSKLKPGDEGYWAWVESERVEMKLYQDNPLSKVGGNNKAGLLGLG